MRSGEYGKLNLLVPEYIGFGPCRIGFSLALRSLCSIPSVSLHFPGRKAVQPFTSPFFNATAIMEEVREIFNRVDTGMSAGLKQRVESRGVCIEEKGVHVDLLVIR